MRLRRQVRHDVDRHPRCTRIFHVSGVAVIGEHHNGAALVARGHHHVVQRVAGIAFGIHDDQIRLQLGNALGQEHVGGQIRDQVETVFQQANAQAARTLGLGGGLLVLRIGNVQIRGNDDDTE